MIADRLANFSIGINRAGVPNEALCVLKLSLLDWCSVAISGVAEPVSTIVREQIIAEGGHPQCFVFGSQLKLPARAAALSNGTTSHALDYDDTHFHHVGHTSVVILSAALAIAELERTSGSRFLEAALIGSEAACRLGHWLGSDHYNKGFHQTATAGTFGAALAAAHLLQLDRIQTVHALGIASTRAAGLKCQFGTMGKPYNAGIAAAGGVEAALLAQRGFESRPDAIDCVQGFAETHFANPNRSDLSFEGLSTDYVFTDVQHKFHACCHGLHAAIEALLIIQREHNLNADEITHITIMINPRWLTVCDNKTPKSGLEAKFSFALVSAMVLRGYDTAALTTYSDEICTKPALSEIRDQVETIGDPNVSDTAAIVSVVTKEGISLQANFDLAVRLPLDDREVRVRNKSALLLGEDRSDQLWQNIQNLEQLQVIDLVDELQAIS